MQQEFLHIDATPDENYPLRILQAYRRLGDYRWSDSSSGVVENNVLVKTMNDLQEKRNALLDRAIALLTTQQTVALDASPLTLTVGHRRVMNAKIKGYPNLDVVLRHFDALQILIQHAKKSVDGAKALVEWDIARARPVKEIVFEVIDEPCQQNVERIPSPKGSWRNAKGVLSENREGE